MSSITDEHHGRYDDAEEFRPSRQELILVKQLRERAQSAQGFTEQPVPTKSQTQAARTRQGGIKPLQLLADKNANRMSLPLQPGRVGMLADKFESRVVEKASTGTKASKRSKASSGKENRSVQKGSGTSGVSFGGGLRV
jgi:hypothetical protein